MSRFFRRLEASLKERARHFALTRRTKELLEQQGIAAPWVDSHELLQTLSSVKALLRRVPPVLVDVGAHQGAFARAADAFFHFERILCVEPDTDLAEALARNVPKQKTTIHPCALAEFEGAAELYIHEDRTMNSLVAADAETLRGKFPTYAHDATYKRDVNATTLDALLSEQNVLDGAAIFLKLDTQGNELNILHAGEATLRHTEACLIEFMFCNPYARTYDFRALIDFFYDRGFECRGALSIMRRPSQEVSGVDFLFTRFASVSNHEFPAQHTEAPVRA